MSRFRRVIKHNVWRKDGHMIRYRREMIINLDYITTVREEGDMKGDDEAHHTPSVHISFSSGEGHFIEGRLEDFYGVLDAQPMDENGRNIIGERIDAKKDSA